MRSWLRIGALAGAALSFIALAPGRDAAPLRDVWLVSPPAGSEPARIDPAGRTVIPNGRVLTPRGRQIIVAPHPFGLVLSPDGSVAVTANGGIEPFSVSVVENVTGRRPLVRQIPPGPDTDKGVLASVYMGLAVSPDNRRLYVGGGQEGKIVIFDLARGRRVAEIDANGRFDKKTYEDSYIGDLALSRDGEVLYALDQANFRLIIASAAKRRVIGSVGLGRYPFGLTLSPDGRRAYAANAGLFEYNRVEGVAPERPERQGLPMPPFSYLSREAREGTQKDGYRVPGLGDPNVPESCSVWEVDVRDPRRPVVTARVKTGVPVGEPVEGVPAVGGSSPNSVVATDSRVFVSNGSNDSISVIDTDKDAVVGEIRLSLDPKLESLRGVIPFGLALAADASRLYVAEAGINAVAVVDVRASRVLGHIPVGWFPSKLAISRDGKSLIVANAKGFGSGPNGGREFTPGPEGVYIGNLMKGTVAVLRIPDDAALAAETRQVVSNNFLFRRAASSETAARKSHPIPLFPGEKKSPIKHVVLVVKENRTFDEVFGQVAGADGDPALARYGAVETFANKKWTRRVKNAVVMPNHLNLARRYAISDNFYCDSDVSADGHRWLVGTYPNEWVEVNTAQSYGSGRDIKFHSSAPGVLAFVGASAAIYPEDYNEAGSIWDHLARHHVDYFNFGLSVQFATQVEDSPRHKYTGTTHVVNYPAPDDLLAHTSSIFATFNTSIPDQFRVDMLIKEFKERWLGPKADLPAFLTVYLPNDHGAGERPAEGYPFRESYMADNDLALGRLVEFLSQTPHWRETAVFVTEDDPQNGVDHVDAHRSVLMVISPYAKRNYVGHVHASFGSIIKTAWNILGLPYLNQYDAGAADLSEMFSDRADAAPYVALPSDPRIFDPQKALDPLDEKFNWQSLRESPRLDDPETIRKWMEEERKD